MKLFDNFKERAAYAGARIMATVAPQYAINHCTRKSYANAEDFLPSEKQQIKAVEKMGVEDIQQRCWSSEVLKYIFCERNMFWQQMSDMEFYNFLEDFNTVLKAIKFLSESQKRTVVIRHGITRFLNAGHDDLVRDVVSTELMNHGSKTAEWMPVIASSSELKSIYKAFLRNHVNDLNSMPVDVVVEMVRYWFGLRKPLACNLITGGITLQNAMMHANIEPLVWLSIAYNMRVYPKVRDILKEKKDYIFKYLENNPLWRESLCNYFFNVAVSFNEKLSYYNMMSSKDINALCEAADSWSDIETCCMMAGSDADAELFQKLIKKAIALFPTKYGRRYIDQESYLLKIMQYGSWSEDQLEVAYRAMAAAGCMSNVRFVKLSERHKNAVMEEMEILSQIKLIEYSVQDIIENKIKLHPVAEKYLFSSREKVNVWEAYFAIHELSNPAWYAMLQSCFLTVSTFTCYVRKYGMTADQYRALLQSDKAYLAPVLKQYLK